MSPRQLCARAATGFARFRARRALDSFIVAAGALIASYAPGHAQPLELDSGVIPSGGVFEHAFNAAGRYDYHCSIHIPMRGTIVVSAAASLDSAFVRITGPVLPGFTPDSLSIKPGARVRWQNVTSVAHTVTSDTATPARSISWGRLKALYE